MRIAVIDLGTNTFHLLVAETYGQDFKVLHKTNVPVKLGEGRINDNIIIPAAFERGINCLKTFSETMLNYQVDLVKATATSAVRSADNGKDFVAAVKAQTKIEIEILSGEQEAELIYEGVKLSGAIDDLSLIMDIGGGSVEFILCDTEKLIWKKSYNIGAARLMQRFFKSDPISDQDKNNILAHIQEALEDLFAICQHYQPKTLIGSAGAFETFAELVCAAKNETIDIDKVISYFFDFDEYIVLSIKLINSTHQQRAEMPGIIPLRIDLIVIAAMITNFVLGRLKINQLRLSSYDLKMGILADQIQRH